jgi:hypothetical protein
MMLTFLTPESNTLILLFAALVVAVFVIQTLAVVSVARSFRSLTARLDVSAQELMREVSSVSGRVSSVSDKVDEFLSTARETTARVHKLQDNLTATSEVLHKRALALDAFLQEGTDALRLQMARVQDAVDTAARRVEDTFSVLQRGVLAPVHEVNAVATGLRAALGALFKPRKGPSVKTPHDEEMFI